MFEIFAKEFGSYEMSDIKRQKTSWGNEVALSFSEGNVKKAINILKDNNRLHISNNKIDSMELLLNNWDNSTEKLENRLIIGVKNVDVDNLNIGARELLKSKKILSGLEISITKNNKQLSFMKNDRIVFTKTNKELNINNGDFATLDQITDRNFIVKFDNGINKSFNPKEFNDFKHGYASTIYKAQGSSINDVHVFHDGFSTNKNSYVAMSRHENNLNLYINNESTKTDYQLIKQLSFNVENQASINHYTEKQLNAKILSSNIFVKTYEKFTNKFKNKITNLFDKYNVNDNYYIFETSEITNAKVEKVLDSVDRLNSKININEMETKKQFYANRDYHLNKSQFQTIDFKYENDKLRNEIKYHAETIARDMLGEVNKKLSNETTLRFGEKGSVAVKINGEKCGAWYDFSKEKGGDLFQLVQEIKNCNFKEAADYLSENYSSRNLEFASSHRLTNEYVDHYKNEAANKAKEQAVLKKVEILYQKSKITLNESTAFKYLNDRNINCKLSPDIKTTGIFDKETGQNFPALICFARNKDGELTSYQYTVLDPTNYKKADIITPRRSFGKIHGSFVTVNNQINSEKNPITIIAEGLETALSIKQAGIDAKILCSLGVSNIKNYIPAENEKIIIAADNDGIGANSDIVIEDARKILSQNNMVLIVKPPQIGDFNDLLSSGQIENKSSVKQIKELFDKTISKLNIYNDAQLKIIINSEKILSEKTHIDQFIANNKTQMDLFKIFNLNYDIVKLQNQLTDLNDFTKERLFKYELRSECLIYINKFEENLKIEKSNAKSVNDMTNFYLNEKEFYKNIYNKYKSLLPGEKVLKELDYLFLMKSNFVNEFVQDVKYIVKHNLMNEQDLFNNLKNSNDLPNIAKSLFDLSKEHKIEVIDKKLTNLNDINSPINQNIKLNETRNYLEKLIHDKELRPYVEQYASTKLAEINRLDMNQRLEQYEYKKEQQQELDLLNKQKDFSYTC